MRDMLRSQLQEDTAAIWTDAKLNNYLNLGLQFMQTAVLAHNPEAFLEIDRTDYYENDDGLVPKPLGCIRIKDVKVKYDGDSAYVFAVKKRNDEIEGYIEAYTSSTMEDEPIWSNYGNWIRIWPEADADSTDGVELVFVPTLTMGADTDVPHLALHLHEGVVYRAKEIALGGPPDKFDIDLDHEAGWGF
jgi:hypothetical protein